MCDNIAFAATQHVELACGVQYPRSEQALASGVLTVTSKNRLSNQLMRLSECDLSEEYTPKGRPLGTSRPQEDAAALN
jgi:hypothetical protein